MNPFLLVSILVVLRFYGYLSGKFREKEKVNILSAIN